MSKPTLNITATDIMVGDKSLMATLDKIQERLAILEPNTALNAKYEALREAYNHYKVLEALLREEEK